MFAWIFRAKLEDQKNDLFRRQLLGLDAAYINVIEFQKRDLLHAHFLLILKYGSKVHSFDWIDKFVFLYEILDKKSLSLFTSYCC